MTTRATVTFDGTVLRPETPLELNLDTKYEIIIAQEIPSTLGKNAWDLLDELAGTIDGPEDWSEEHDHYIHGTAKRNGQK